MSKILKNVTNSNIDISDVGKTILANTSYTVPPQEYNDYAASNDLVGFVGNSEVIVNDGFVDLGIADGINFMQGKYSVDLGGASVVGPQGDQGIQGIQGIQGTQGDQGDQGIQGDQGAQGVQGDIGAQGDQGTQGIQGIQGDQGVQGDQGLQGIQGETGPMNVEAFISKTSTVTLPNTTSKTTIYSDSVTIDTTGNCFLDISLAVRGHSPSNDLEFDLLFDGNILNPVYAEEHKDNNNAQSNWRHQTISLGNVSAGTYSLVLRFSKESTGGTAQLKNYTVKLVRY